MTAVALLTHVWVMVNHKLPIHSCKDHQSWRPHSQCL